MIDRLSPRAHIRAVAALLGESERAVRGILLACLLVALLASLAWVGAAVDMNWLPSGHAGSARVLHAFVGLAALSCLAVAAGLVTLGRWAAPAEAA